MFIAVYMSVRRLVVAVRKISRSAAENQFASSSDQRGRAYILEENRMRALRSRQCNSNSD